MILSDKSDKKYLTVALIFSAIGKFINLAQKSIQNSLISNIVFLAIREEQPYVDRNAVISFSCFLVVNSRPRLLTS